MGGGGRGLYRLCKCYAGSIDGALEPGGSGIHFDWWGSGSTIPPQYLAPHAKHRRNSMYYSCTVLVLFWYRSNLDCLWLVRLCYSFKHRRIYTSRSYDWLKSPNSRSSSLPCTTSSTQTMSLSVPDYISKALLQLLFLWPYSHDINRLTR